MIASAATFTPAKTTGAEGHPHANVVIGDVVHWPTISKGSPEAWLYFYEGFLSVHDNALSRRTGSYYTPPEIVTAMVRLVDEILRDDRRFGVAEGIITPETSPVTPRQGVVCFITVAGFLNGPGFQKMRPDLRRDTDEIWVIDCSPEGHQPLVASRVFQAVQQPVCIVLAVRLAGCDLGAPARVRFRTLPVGPREDKFAAISAVTLDSRGWIDCPDDWRAPFLPASTGEWAAFPALQDFFVYNSSGVMPGRTWVIAPDAESLRRRWNALIQENNPERKELLFHPHIPRGKLGDRHTAKVPSESLHGQTNLRRPNPDRGSAAGRDMNRVANCIPAAPDILD